MIRNISLTPFILIIASVLLIASFIWQTTYASAAEPNQAASCLGHEAASISPPGTLDEFPGGMSEVSMFFRDAGIRFGDVVRLFAQLHEGSHEACDEALE